MKFVTLSFVLATVVSFVAVTSFASESQKNDSLDEPVKYKTHYPINFLIMTSNYESPRKLAEIARLNKEVSYILLPAKTTSDPIIFIPPKAGNAIEVPAGDLSRFIAFMRPKTVIVLGDETIVPEQYRKAIPEKTRVANIGEPTWKVNAIMLGNILNYQKVPALYDEYLKEKAAQAQLDRKIAEEALKRETKMGK